MAGRPAAGSTTTRRSSALLATAVATAGLFQFQDSRLDEVSGIGASALNDGIVWVHNDSGDEALLYAVDEGGHTVSTLELGGGRAVDWEDMALAGGQLYAADIGDNREQRDSVQIYRVDEPEVMSDTTLPAERMDLRYPDGAHDAEALLVHPATGEIGVITKEEDDAGLYVTKRFVPGETTLTRAADVSLDQVTGSAVAPDGRSLVVRDYVQAYLFTIDGTDLASAFDDPPQRVDMPFAIQAEAITFTPDGRSLLTTHEGAGATVFEIPLPAEGEPATEEAPVRPRTPWPLLAGSGVIAGVLTALALRYGTNRRRTS